MLKDDGGGEEEEDERKLAHFLRIRVTLSLCQYLDDDSIFYPAADRLFIFAERESTRGSSNGNYSR